MEVIWSERAKNDLEKALDYLETNWGRATTLKFITKLEKIQALIILNPNSFQKLNKPKLIIRND